MSNRRSTTVTRSHRRREPKKSLPDIGRLACRESCRLFRRLNFEARTGSGLICFSRSSAFFGMGHERRKAGIAVEWIEQGPFSRFAHHQERDAGAELDCCADQRQHRQRNREARRRGKFQLYVGAMMKPFVVVPKVDG